MPVRFDPMKLGYIPKNTKPYRYCNECTALVARTLGASKCLKHGKLKYKSKQVTTEQGRVLVDEPVRHVDCVERNPKLEDLE